MNKKEAYHLIDRYLDNQLEGLELRHFEDQIEKDPALAQRIKLESELREAINDKSDYNHFNRMVKETSATYFDSDSVKSFAPYKIAATITLLVSATWLIWTINQSNSPEGIYDEYFEPYVIQTTPRSLTDDSDDYMMGTIHYRDGEYERAIKIFNKLLIETPDDYRAQLMLGISYMALKDFDSAEPILTRLAEDRNHLFQDQARWYLGLLYLTDEDLKNDGKAKAVFEGIEDEKLKGDVQDLN